MHRIVRTVFLGTLVFALAGLLPAQEKPRASPHETISAKVGEGKITIEYGRPYKKGRKIFGGLEPFGKVWRTGADEATTFTTTAGLMVGGIHVPAGTYSLFTLPTEKDWTLILNKTAKQWGAFKYDEKQDLGRTPLNMTRAATPLEQLTISIEPAAAGKATLKIAWDDRVGTAEIMAH
jgi:hypothetical protein